MCQLHRDAFERYFAEERTIATCRKCGAIRSMTDDEFHGEYPLCICDGGSDLTGQFFNDGSFVLGSAGEGSWVVLNPHERVITTEDEGLIFDLMDFAD